jgi:putative ABC transport system permease protein
VLTRSLLSAGLRDLVRRPLHTGLMVLGVALGVAVVIAVDLANTSAARGFVRSTEAIAGRATHVVRGGPSGLPQETFRRLRVERGLRASAPVVEGDVVALDLDRQPLHVLGVDPFSEGSFGRHVARGTLGAGGLSLFFTEPRGVLVGSGLEERYGLDLGAPLRVQVQDRVETLTLVGVVTPAEEGERRAMDGLLVMDVGAAQHLFGLEGRLSRIDLIATPAEAASLADVLPPGAHVVAASDQSATVSQLTAAFQLNLRALSLLALLVGMFLIYNTVLFSVVQRRAVIGTLRTLGVTGEQAFLLVIAETAAAAAIGTVLGLGLGWGLAQGAVRLVTRTINDLYYVLAVVGAPFTALAVAKGVLLGVGAGVVAAIAPALEAARIEPATALRPSTFEGRAHRLLPWAAAGGLLAAAAGGAVLLAFPRSLAASFAGLFGIVVGLALLAPAATVLLMRGAGPVASVAAGVLGRIAARTITRAVSRTGVAIAALMVAVSVTIGVSLMIASFRSTVVNWLDLTLKADIYVSAPGAVGTRASPVLSADAPARVAAVPGVAEVETYRSVRVMSDVGEIHLGVTDARRPRSAALYRFAAADPKDVWERVRAGAVIVSEPFAHRHHVPPDGGRLVLKTDRGDRAFPVAGIFYDYATEEGTVLMSRDVYDRSWDDRAVSSIAVYVEEGRPVPDVADALRRALSGTALGVRENRALRAQALRVFDRTFAVTEALRILAVVVAFIGVWSALMALLTERTRELATLQALGLTPGQLTGLTLLETGLMGAAAGLLSLPTGTLLAVILVDVINVRSFGWTMRLELLPSVYAQAMAVSVLAALLAGVYPLRRLQRRSLAAALRQE